MNLYEFRALEDTLLRLLAWSVERRMSGVKYHPKHWHKGIGIAWRYIEIAVVSS